MDPARVHTSPQGERARGASPNTSSTIHTIRYPLAGMSYFHPETSRPSQRATLERTTFALGSHLDRSTHLVSRPITA